MSNTGIPYLGGTLHEGDYCDLTADEAAQWNILYGANLYPGRYRMVRVCAWFAPTAQSSMVSRLVGDSRLRLVQAQIVGAGTVTSGDEWDIHRLFDRRWRHGCNGERYGGQRRHHVRTASLSGREYDLGSNVWPD